MLEMLLYLLVALAATAAGSLTGMGGGVIIKPVLDMLHQFPPATINILSSLTVLCMSVVSVGRNIYAKSKLNFRIAVPLAAGAVAGGILGDELIARLIAATGGGSRVTLVQNAVLGGLIVVVFVYMLVKHKLPTLGLSGTVPSLLVGLFLGCASSFLGIGGGPINVAVIMFVFSMPTKDACLSSLVIILFSQLASFGTSMATGAYAGHDFSMLPAMIVGAVAGGLLGSQLQRKFTEKQVDIMFNAVQVIVLGLCVYNIVQSI